MSRSPSTPLLVAFVAAGALLVGQGQASGYDPADARAARPRVQVSADDFAKLVKSVDREEQDLRKRLEALNREARIADARTLARGRAYVRLARVGLLPVGEGFEALADHAARLERLRHGIEADLALVKRLAAERVAIGKKLDEIDARRGTLEVERQVLEQAETALRAAEERDQAFEQAFEAPSHTAVYGAGVGPSDPQASLLGFASQKGRLPFPIAGRTVIRPARRPSSDGAGLELKAPPGSAVRSVFQGRIAFADTYPEYGKTVIIDHGHRHYTLSANLGAIEAKVGDEVATGERIGTLSSEKDAALYFEIRVNKTTVEPGEWFGI
ncbi:MAG TPA: peptidoglycan DD-metalloendopeptidase family protein [Polyangiaceae bacterium]|nr:peptidoglycan DD-metalloendopeptidase family protein [Polyangiaceae bacterium]